MGRSVLFLAFLWLLSLPSKASFEFNTNCINAYNAILSLKLNSAKSLIAAEKRRNPDNSIPYLLDNYVDYFTIITSESKADFDRLKNNKSARLDRIEDDDKKSPYYLYCQSEINLQWALLCGRFQEYFTAAVEINRAYSQIQENSKKFPGFLPDRKNLGMLNALLGSLPDGLKKTLSTFGIRGNTQTGVTMLKSVVNNLPSSAYSHYYPEAVFYLAYVQLDILNDQAAYPSIISNTTTIDSSSLLRTYIRAYAGMKCAHNDDAISILLNKPSGSAYQPYPYLDYLLGNAFLNKRDGRADNFLMIFLKTTRGVNYIKDAWLKIAWVKLLDNDLAGYNSYIQNVKSKGYTYHEKDKQALSEANDAAPDKSLLTSRLLFDGGYYTRALEEISDKKVESIARLRDKIEFNYRSGRILDEMGKDDAAIKYYQAAVNIGRNERYYYASNAALRIATIYEKRKAYSSAKSYYNLVLQMKDHDYESSIENKAREGLKRISG